MVQMEMSKIGRASQLNIENYGKINVLMNILAEVCRLLFSGTQRKQEFSVFCVYKLLYCDLFG